MTDAERDLADFDALADIESRQGFLAFLPHVVVNAQPDRLPFGYLAEPWQWERERRRAGALDALAGLNRNYPGKWWFWSGCAKGNDKSTGVGRRLLYLLAYARRPLQLYICSGKEEQAAIITLAMKGELEANPWLRDRAWVSDYSGGGKSGSELHVLPMKAATGQGIFPDYLVADELTHWEHDEGRKFWDFILGSVGKRARACVFEVCTNAGFKGSWQWDVRNAYAKSSSWDFYEQPAGSTLAGWLDADRIEQLAAGMSPGEKRRLHGNEWIDPGEENGVVSLSEALACVDPALDERTEGDPKLRYYAIVDYGEVHDRTAMCVMHNVPGTDRVVIDRLDVWQGSHADPVQIEVPEDWVGKDYGAPAPRSVEGWINLTRSRFKVLACVFDKYQLLALAQKLQRKNVRVEVYDYLAGKRNYLMVQLLQEMIRNRKLSWSEKAGHLEGADDPTFAIELARLVKKPMSYGYKLDHTSSGFNDRCLVAGTIVDTDRGPVAIEHVVPGDKVLTRLGYRTVLESGQTGVHDTVRVAFSNGSTLEGTADHPVWTNRGWARLDSLDESHTVYTWSKQQNTTAGLTAATQSRSAGITGFTSNATIRQGSEFDTCIGMCGLMHTGRSRRGTTSTTRTTTRSTTTCQTLSALAGRITPPCTTTAILPRDENGSRRTLGKSTCGSTGNECGRWLLIRPVSTSDVLQQRRDGSGERDSRSSASCAPPNSRPRFPAGRNTVQTPVAFEQGTTQLGSSTKPAPCATRCSGPISITQVRLAEVSVLGRCAGATGPVFDLKVDEAPEFFANGILVHNSVCVAMGLCYAVPETRPAGKHGPTAVPRETEDPNAPNAPLSRPVAGPSRDWARERGLWGMGRGR